MSYRKAVNEHERWENLIRKNNQLVKDTELPLWLFTTEARFREYLQDGGVNEVEGSVQFTDFPDERFLKLENLVNHLFDFTCQFSAFDRERFRRFKRYG